MMNQRAASLRTSSINPRYVLAVIIGITVVFNNIEWSLGGNNLTLERLLAAPIFFIAVLLLVSSNIALRLPKTGMILTVWIVLAFYASASGPVEAWSLKMYAGLLLAASFYYVVIWLKANPFSIFKSRSYLLLAWFSGPVLSVIYVLSLLKFPLPDLAVHWLQEGSGGTRIRGGIYEANLFGVFVSLITLTVLALGYYRKLWWWVLVIGLHTALLFSFSRAPWVSYIISVWLYHGLSYPRKYTNRDVVKYLLGAALLVAVISLLSYFIASSFGDYELIGRTHSVKTRFIMWGLAANSILENPLFGNGIYSFSEIYSFAPELVGSENHRSAWISNLPLAILNDTGAVGFIVFFAFIILVIKRSLTAVRKLAIDQRVDRYHVRVGAALVAFFLAMTFSSQTIPAHSIAIFWVCLALTERFTTLSRSLIKRT
ncbi:O-antigen ligase family protein [Pseudomonas farris]